MPFVSLEISNDYLGRTLSENAYPLPVVVGRGRGATLKLEPENRMIARVHLEMHEGQGGFDLVNRSTTPGATRLRDRSLATGEAAEVRIGDVIRVLEFRLKVLEAASLRLIASSTKGTGRRIERLMLPSRALLIYETDTGLGVEAAASLEAIDPTRFADRFAVLFYHDGGHATFAQLGDPEARPVRLDGGRVEQQAIYLNPWDTITVGPHRFEIHPVGARAITCANPVCAVVNPLGDDPALQLCRVCGRPVAGSMAAV